MNTNGKNKNASHLTHEMKKEHGGLLEASKKAEMQPIFKALWGIAQEEKECNYLVSSKLLNFLILTF
ncbi:hypothetical protein ACLGAP_05370 [Helicobacter pylori]